MNLCPGCSLCRLAGRSARFVKLCADCEHSYCPLLPTLLNWQVLTSQLESWQGGGDRTRMPFEFAMICAGQPAIWTWVPCCQQMTWRNRDPIVAFCRLDNSFKCMFTNEIPRWDVGEKPTTSSYAGITPLGKWHFYRLRVFHQYGVLAISPSSATVDCASCG